MGALYSGATGLNAQQKYIDVIANNLANVNTTAFKNQSVNFQDLFYQTLQLAGTPSSTAGTQIPTGIQVGTGTKVVSTERNFTQGSGFRSTNNDFNLAIAGKGFFRIRLPDGNFAYTRDGSFQRDSDGVVTTSDGLILDSSGEIRVNEQATAFNVNPEGTVVQTFNNNRNENIGDMKLYNFINPAGLRAIGQNLLVKTDASGNPIEATPGQQGLGKIKQHFLETSNVNVANELIALITAQRAYEVNSKTIQTADSILGTVGSLKR